jgi:hypothetical protein
MRAYLGAACGGGQKLSARLTGWLAASVSRQGREPGAAAEPHVLLVLMLVLGVAVAPVVHGGVLLLLMLLLVVVVRRQRRVLHEAPGTVARRGHLHLHVAHPPATASAPGPP